MRDGNRKNWDCNSALGSRRRLRHSNRKKRNRIRRRRTRARDRVSVARGAEVASRTRSDSDGQYRCRGESSAWGRLSNRGGHGVLVCGRADAG